MLLGAVVLVGGLLLLWILDELIGVSRAYMNAMARAIELTTVVVLVAYVARNRRR